jgi:hypothetical protein
MVSRTVFVLGEVSGGGTLSLMCVVLVKGVVGGVVSGELLLMVASLGFGLGGAEIPGLKLGLVGNVLWVFGEGMWTLLTSLGFGFV